VLYAFGEFELDADAHELRRAGKRRRVQPKVFQLLRYLIEHRERVVTKDELMSALWAAEHVTESSLFVAVRAARAALEQQHGASRPIHTLRGSGYRFADEVEELPSTGGKSSPPRSARPSPPPSNPWDALVGRRTAMQALRDALARTVGGQGQLVLLSGEPGIGKTRCAEALCELAERKSVRVLDARCLEADGAPPFWPWIQLLRRALSDAEPQETAQEARALLSALAPDTRATDPTEPLRTGWEVDRFWILDRTVGALQRLLKSGPSLIVLDDLQWADESSLRLLQLFAAELERLPCLVVCTVREPRATPDPAREKLLKSLARGALVLELSGLSEAETRELVGTVAASLEASELVTELHRQTGGNPLFLREMLRLQLENPGAGPLSGNSLPRVVRDVIRGRLDEVGARAREVLRAASVLGVEVDVTLLQRVSERSTDELFEGLDEALDARLMITTDSADRFAFTHEMVRAALHDELSHAERVRLHTRAGEALESRGGDDGWQGEAAYHFHQALAGGVHEKALRLSTKAARSAVLVGGYESAARYLRWALDALDRHPKDAPRTRAELTVELGATVLAQGRPSEAREHFRAVAAIAERHGYGDLLAQAATWMRPNITLAPMPDELALHVLERALDLLGPEQVVWRAHVLSRLAWIWPNCEDMPKCKRLAEEALALARTAGAPGVQGPLLSALAARLYSLCGPDDLEALLSTAEEVLDLERRASRQTWHSAQAQLMRYHAFLLGNRRAEADAALDEFGALVRRQKLAEPMLWHDRLVAQRAFYQGRFAEAETAFLEQHARGKRLGLSYADLYLGIQMFGLIHERVGPRQLPPMPAAPAEGWNMPVTPGFRAARLALLADAGASSETRAEWLALTQNDFAAIPRDLNYLHALANLSQVAIAVGDVANARKLYQLLGPHEGMGTPTLLSQVMGSVAYYRGLLARFLGRDEEAVLHFERALSLHQSMGYAPWVARTQLALAQALRAPGLRHNEKRAQALLGEARSGATALGMSPLLDRMLRQQEAAH